MLLNRYCDFGLKPINQFNAINPSLKAGVRDDAYSLGFSPDRNGRGCTESLSVHPWQMYSAKDDAD